ncbi:MAG TPA: YcjX family protein, partial [Afifellaceae bacterium]|nr:YcjX family protein [Afifellaceae bacterium]
MAAATRLSDEVRIAFDNLVDTVTGGTTPTLRLGVTGLSRAGKTVFITALVHNLIYGGRLPLFGAYAEGRLADAELQPQPDDAVPRFAYEDHVRDLVQRRIWPQSTRQISELRLTIHYESARMLKRRLGPGTLHLDIVDYPGEWLLDLPLLNQSFAEWSESALALARAEGRAEAAAPFLSALGQAAPLAELDEPQAQALTAAFKDYLAAARAAGFSGCAPGRFLMPGELEGSPALTFCPLPKPETRPKGDSLYAAFERRFEAYKRIVVKPFFRDHFARIDRQIVLVDALGAIRAGPRAVEDLRVAMADILSAFRPGKNTWLSRILTRRVERVAFAATKADHLHHSQHAALAH